MKKKDQRVCCQHTKRDILFAVQGSFDAVGNFPAVSIDIMEGTVEIDSRMVSLSAGEFALFCVMARRVRQNRPCLQWQDLEDDLAGFRSEPGRIQEAAWHATFRDLHWDWKEDTRKRASRLRRKLAEVLRDKRLVDALVPTPRSDIAAPYPGGKIVFRE